jgi:hypothetical protein
MPMNDGFDPDHPLPPFSLVMLINMNSGRPLNMSCCARRESSRPASWPIAVMAGGIAIAISLGIPAKVFSDATALLPDTSAPQPSANQAAPPIQSDAQAIQPTADAQAIETTADAKASAPTTSAPPTRDEIVAAAQPASQTQTENREPDTEALFTEYQAWAAKKNTQAQNAAQPSHGKPISPIHTGQSKSAGPKPRALH